MEYLGWADCLSSMIRICWMVWKRPSWNSTWDLNSGKKCASTFMSLFINNLPLIVRTSELPYIYILLVLYLVCFTIPIFQDYKGFNLTQQWRKVLSWHKFNQRVFTPLFSPNVLHLLQWTRRNEHENKQEENKFHVSFFW